VTSGCRNNRYITSDVRPADSESCQCWRTKASVVFFIAGGARMVLDGNA